MKIFHHVKRKFFTINKMLQHSAIVSQKSFGTILNSLTFNKIICNQQMINSSGNVVPDRQSFEKCTHIFGFKPPKIPIKATTKIWELKSDARF